VVVRGPKQPSYVPSSLIGSDDNYRGSPCGKADRSRRRCLLGGDGSSEGGNDRFIEDLRSLNSASLYYTAEPNAGRSGLPSLYGVVNLGLYNSLSSYYYGLRRQALIAVGNARKQVSVARSLSRDFLRA